MTIVHRFLSNTWAGKALPSTDRYPSSSGSGSNGGPVQFPRLLACSAAKILPHHYDVINGRPLCSDRKGAFVHLQYSRVGKSTVRVVIIQSSQIMSQYLNDQLSSDIARDELVNKGEMTQRSADKEGQEWSEREWKKRWEGFEHRVFVALAKYHSIILIMRLYEEIASKSVQESTLDTLTLDTFESAKRRANKQDGVVLVRGMFDECWRANLIGFMADYSVHQVILVFGYYVYVRGRQKKLKQQDETDDDDDDAESSSKNIHSGSLAISLIKKSTLLVISRGIALGFASFGGAVGSLMLPGWGTLAGTNLGDSIASSLLDDMLTPPKLS